MKKRKTVPKVSVIIPVYQKEIYLKECVTSVLKQNYGNLEIILVDDGSSDGCSALCDQYAGEYDRIQVIHQENQGPGAARNTGLKKAQGKFVMFLDADDRLSRSDVVWILTDTALQNRADIVTGNYRRFKEQDYGPVIRHHLEGGAYVKTVDFRLHGFLMEDHLLMDCAKLYKKDFLIRNHLWCKKRNHMEDKLRNMMCCTCEPVYAFVDDCIYLYRITEGSSTQQYRNKTEELEKDWIYVAAYFYRYLRRQQKLEQFGDLLAFHVFCGIFTLGRQPLQAGMERRKEAVEILKNYGKNPLVHNTLLALAEGYYLKGIRSLFWRILLQGGSFLFCIKAYRLIVWGIILLQGLGTEHRTSRMRNGIRS